MSPIQEYKGFTCVIDFIKNSTLMYDPLCKPTPSSCRNSYRRAIDVFLDFIQDKSVESRNLIMIVHLHKKC